MKKLSAKSMRIAAVAAIYLVFCFVSSSAQTSESSDIGAGKPTVRELVTSAEARFAVVNMSVGNDVMRATIILTNPDGSTIGGYGTPYLQRNEEVRDLWRDFISTNLNITTQIDEITVTENRITDDTSFAIAFVIDYSPSITIPIAFRLQRAIKAALTQFAPRDFVSIIKFTGRVNVEVPATNNKAEYTSKFLVDGLNMRVSGSAVFDAAARGIEEISSTKTERRLLVLLTDGEDNASSMNMQDVIALAKKTNTEIHTVTYGVGNDEVLSGLSLQTGGRRHMLHDVYDFDKIFMDVYASMRHSYDIVVRTKTPNQVTRNLSYKSIISLSPTADDTIQPMDILYFMPTQGVQVNHSSARSDQSFTLNVDLKFEGEASEISAADMLTLDSIVIVLLQRADLVLEIVPAGDDASVAPGDVAIAQRRVSAVRDLLISRGVHLSRVQVLPSRKSSVPQTRGTSRKITFVFTKL